MLVPVPRESEASDPWDSLASLAYMWALDEDGHTDMFCRHRQVHHTLTHTISGYNVNPRYW